MNSSGTDTLQWLSSKTLDVGIDPATGAIAELRSADRSWSMLDRPHLGVSFRLLVPLADRRMNYVEGADQNPPTISWSDDRQGVTLDWASVRSQHGGEHPIGVHIKISAVDQRVVFSIEIDNQSDVIVENVDFPFLGDVQAPDQNGQFFAFGYTAGGGRRRMLKPHFENDMGFCMVDSPTFAMAKANSLGAIGAPVTPFVLLENGEKGLYWGVDEPSAELVTWHGELYPGWSDSIGHWVPTESTISGLEVALRFGAVHVPYIVPGERRRLTDIALQAFDGDWHAGADVYIARRNTWMAEASIPAWVSEPHSWQQIQLTCPEDSLKVPYSELPTIARECAARGVTALQITGWNDGGQDRNNPSHDADPRLGGPEELKRAIAECQALGVKVIIFTKFVWADRATERFRDELIRLAVKDPYGDYYNFPGFRYHTMTQLLDINTRRFAPMCFQSEEWIKVCQAEFAKVVALGADGILHDEALHHSPALLCFDESHGHRLGAPVYARDAEFVDLLRQIAPTGDPDYLYAAEACYDWMFQTYQLSYSRSIDPAHMPLRRYLRPHMPILTAISGFDDRNSINQCLLYRYIASYEPFMFKGRLTDFDQTIRYGRQMDDLRTELREWFWDGEFRDTVGAAVTDVDGKPHDFYSVYTSARGGAPGVVLVNYGHEKEIRALVDVHGVSVPYRYRLVDDETWRDAQPHVVVPPRSAAVIVPA
jgi:hypothetical protein